MLDLSLNTPEAAPLAEIQPRHMSEANAIDIWIARWLHVRRKDILARYGCDPRRLYDIWEGKRFPASREKAMALFAARYPGLDGRADTSFHRRIPRPGPVEGQPMLFETLPERTAQRNGRRR